MYRSTAQTPESWHADILLGIVKIGYIYSKTLCPQHSLQACHKVLYQKSTEPFYK